MGVGLVQVPQNAFPDHLGAVPQPRVRPEVRALHLGAGIRAIVDDQLVGAATHVQRPDERLPRFYPKEDNNA